VSQKASTRTAGWSSFLSADPPTIVQAPPASAAALFGDRLPLAVAYAEMLAGPGVERGLIGPGEAGRLWERHLLNCAVVAELVPPGADATSCLADLGSGAGLPGIVLAIMLPSVRVLLVEPMARRTAFLLECAEALKLGNVEVRRGRAEELAGQIQADVVTSRAVARLDRLAELAVGLARPGGLVLAMKGASAVEELRQAGPALLRLGARDAEVIRAGTGVVDPPATVVRFRAGDRSARVVGFRAGDRSARVVRSRPDRRKSRS
jgi:16S rRNA (guanine527-N7)-methyltransferase